MDKKQVRYFIKSRGEILKYREVRRGVYKVGGNVFVQEMFKHCGEEITEAEYRNLSKHPQGNLILSIDSVKNFTPEMIDVVSPSKSVKIGIFKITERK